MALDRDGRGVVPPRLSGVLDRAAKDLDARRVELVRPRSDALAPRELPIEAFGERLARHQDQVGRAVDERESLFVADRRGLDLDAVGAGNLEGLGDVVDAAVRRAHHPDSRAGWERRDLVDELDIAGA